MKTMSLAVVLLASQAFAQASPGSNKISLLTPEDLDGGAVGLEVHAIPSQRRTVNQAMYAALVTQEQINRVQLYLKSGPAQNGDLRVIQTGKPDLNQK